MHTTTPCLFLHWLFLYLFIEQFFLVYLVVPSPSSGGSGWGKIQGDKQLEIVVITGSNLCLLSFYFVFRLPLCYVKKSVTYAKEVVTP
jgi:hypothetical protein